MEEFRGQGAFGEETGQNRGNLRHMLVPIPGGKQWVCKQCKRLGVKFLSGECRKSYYQCLACNVPLCRMKVRDCFQQWHADLNIN